MPSDTIPSNSAQRDSETTDAEMDDLFQVAKQVLECYGIHK